MLFESFINKCFHGSRALDIAKQLEKKTEWGKKDHAVDKIYSC